LKRLVLGSVARNLVLHAPSSVLVIRSSLAAAAHQREEFATTTMG
jgi:hypothetical protein